MNNSEAQARLARVETLLEELEALPDQKAKAVATEALQSLLELYGEGLARIMANASRLGSAELTQSFMDDELVSHLLVLHDLHPVSVEARVLQALAEVRPYLASHGGNVELLGIERGVARLRLQGSCKGCPSSTATLKLTIEQAIQQAAPEIVGIEAVDAIEAGSLTTGFIPLSILQVGRAKPVVASEMGCSL